MMDSLSDDVGKLRQSLKDLPEPQVKSPFVVVSGLPGTGKSFFCRMLAARLPFVILASDSLRKILFSSPGYTEAENKRLFNASHALIEELLRKGIPVILDATNLQERHREYLYHIADRVKAKLILVRIEAPPELIRQRLIDREGTPDPGDDSQADWGVYQKMKPRKERFRRNHFVVDTSRDISPALDKIVRAIRK